jgi:hypothetical protein
MVKPPDPGVSTSTMRLMRRCSASWHPQLGSPGLQKAMIVESGCMPETFCPRPDQQRDAEVHQVPYLPAGELMVMARSL